MLLRVFWAFFLIALLGGTSTQARGINDLFGVIDGAIQSAVIQSTRAEWGKLRREETDCVNSFYASRGSSLQEVIRQGIAPGDVRASEARRACLVSQASGPSDRPDALSYTIDGMTVGERVRFDTPSYQQYQCSPSTQYPGFTWCGRQRIEAGPNGNFNVFASMLHADDGTILYANRSIHPAYFKPGDVENQIEILSKRYRTPTVLRLEPRDGLPGGIIATWGQVVLEPMSPTDVAAIEVGRRSFPGAGMMIDYIGDFQRSARLGLPLFRITGNDGYVWSASYDNSGRGHLRFLATNASKYVKPSPTQQAPASSQIKDSRLNDDVQNERSAAFQKEQARLIAEAKAAAEARIMEIEQRRQAEADTLRQAAERSETRRLAELEVARTKFTAAEQRWKADAEAARKAAEDAEKRYRIDLEAARKAADEAEKARSAAESTRQIAVREAEEANRRADKERDLRNATSLAFVVVLFAVLVVGLVWFIRHYRSSKPNQAKLAGTSGGLHDHRQGTLASSVVSVPPSSSGIGPKNSDAPETRSPLQERMVPASPIKSDARLQKPTDDIIATIDQVVQLANLHRQGVIGRDDFEAMKKTIIHPGSSANASSELEPS